MPAAPAAPPPAAAPAATPAPTPSPAPAPAPAQKPSPAPAPVQSPAAESATPAPIKAEPRATPRKVWDDVEADLEKQFGLTPEPPAQSKPETPPKPPEAKAEPGEAKAPETKTTPQERAKGSPWRLVDQYKGKVAQLEKEVAELRTRAVPEDQWKANQEKLTAAEQRLKQYEDEIRYTKYENSAEFKKDFLEPYQKAWNVAVGELADLDVEDPETGEVRKFQSEDLRWLANMSLTEARKTAERLYGPMADDVMAHRKTVRDLYDKMSGALKTAKEQGAEREAKALENYKQQYTAAAKAIGEAFESANKAIQEHPEHGRWFKPVEGDEEGNALLAKGFEFSRKHFGVNPLTAPNLTPQQRIEIARRHAAIINRSAAYGRLTREVKKLTQERDTLKKELADFQASTPGAGSPSGTKVTPKPMNARDSVMAALEEKFG